MDDELHTLTENLFEEAYKMVDTAKEEKGLAVKRLADAAGKIDAMETEMSALKNLLHAPPTSATPEGGKSPSPHTKHRKPNVKKVIKPLILRCPCNYCVQAIRKLSRKIKTPSKSSVAAAPVATSIHFLEHKSEVKGACLKEGQVSYIVGVWLCDHMTVT